MRRAEERTKREKLGDLFVQVTELVRRVQAGELDLDWLLDEVGQLLDWNAARNSMARSLCEQMHEDIRQAHPDSNGMFSVFMSVRELLEVEPEMGGSQPVGTPTVSQSFSNARALLQRLAAKSPESWECLVYNRRAVTEVLMQEAQRQEEVVRRAAKCVAGYKLSDSQAGAEILAFHSTALAVQRALHDIDYLFAAQNMEIQSRGASCRYRPGTIRAD